MFRSRQNLIATHPVPEDETIAVEEVEFNNWREEGSLDWSKGRDKRRIALKKTE